MSPVPERVEANSERSYGLPVYVLAGFLWLGLAVGSYFASQANTAIVRFEAAMAFWLLAILVKSGTKRKTRVLVTATFMLVLSGIDWAVGIL
jgi:hypothetical protein